MSEKSFNTNSLKGKSIYNLILYFFFFKFICRLYTLKIIKYILRLFRKSKKMVKIKNRRNFYRFKSFFLKLNRSLFCHLSFLVRYKVGAFTEVDFFFKNLKRRRLQRWRRFFKFLKKKRRNLRKRFFYKRQNWLLFSVLFPSRFQLSPKLSKSFHFRQPRFLRKVDLFGFKYKLRLNRLFKSQLGFFYKSRFLRYSKLCRLHFYMFYTSLIYDKLFFLFFLHVIYNLLILFYVISNI